MSEASHMFEWEKVDRRVLRWIGREYVKRLRHLCVGHPDPAEFVAKFRDIAARLSKQPENRNRLLVIEAVRSRPDRLAGRRENVRPPRDSPDSRE